MSTIGASILAEGLLASAETANALCIVVIRWRKLIACAGRGGQGGPGGLGTAAGKGEGVDTCGCHAPSVASPSAARSRPALRGQCFVVDGPPAPAAAAGPETMVYARWLSRQLSWADTLDSNPVPGLGSVG